MRLFWLPPTRDKSASSWLTDLSRVRCNLGVNDLGMTPKAAGLGILFPLSRSMPQNIFAQDKSALCGSASSLVWFSLGNFSLPCGYPHHLQIWLRVCHPGMVAVPELWPHFSRGWGWSLTNPRGNCHYLEITNCLFTIPPVQLYSNFCPAPSIHCPLSVPRVHLCKSYP